MTQVLKRIGLLFIVAAIIPACGGGGGNGGGPAPITFSSLSDISKWLAYDAGSNGVGTDPDGYRGAVFDGRYIYFVPHYNGTTWHGEVLRLDTQGSFDLALSWEAFDPGANGVGTDPDGYLGGVFDGRYVYFAPSINGTVRHGEVLRYDTQGAFTTPGSWVTYNPGANGVGTNPVGYAGAVFDGRFVYFAPEINTTAAHGEVLRYDTQGTFASAGSWLAYDPGANGVGTDADGYAGGVFDGRYIYFVPIDNGSGPHGEVLRLDTQGTFNTPGSWATYTPAANGVGTDPRGYVGGVFDGRYVYFIPWINGSGYHGEVLRLDTQGTFAAAGSWSAFDPGTNGVGTNPDGFYGGVFDGRYVYLIPADNGTRHGEVIRFDTQATFSLAGSWEAFDPGANGVGIVHAGYHGGAFDGRYLYFVPDLNGATYHGAVLRFDAKVPPQIPSTVRGGSFF